jgi:fructose-1,6-bisphosphatase
MYLNLGADFYVLTEDILGIFDLDTANTQADTKDYLKDAENNAMLIYAGYELPKSFVLTVDGTVYFSQYSAKVLKIKAERLLI